MVHAFKTYKKQKKKNPNNGTGGGTAAGEKTPKELAQEKADTIMGPVSEVTSFQWAYGYEYGTVDDKMQSVLNVLSTPYFLSEGDPLLDKTARKIEWKVDNLVELKVRTANVSVSNCLSIIYCFIISPTLLLFLLLSSHPPSKQIGVTKIKNGPSESGVNVLRMNAVAEFPEPLNDISNDSSLADQIAAIFADYGFKDPSLIFDRDVNNDRAGKLLLINLELRATEPASASPKSMKSSKKTQAWHIFVAVALWADVSESYTGHAITNFIEKIFGPLFAPLFNGSLF